MNQRTKHSRQRACIQAFGLEPDRDPQLKQMEVGRFNGYLKDKPIVDVLGQMLLVVHGAMLESVTA